MTRHRRPRLPRGTTHDRLATGQGGFALIVALVLLLVIGLTSVGAMQAMLNSDQAARQSHGRALATQAAQIALHYCETELSLPQADRHITVWPATEAGQWSEFAHWAPGTARAQSVPERWLATQDSSVTWATPAQCLVEQSPLGPSAFIVTARGFGPDHTQDDAGRTLTGAVVWLQSRLLLGP
jgi:type IV pilus assembly protein PilX